VHDACCVFLPDTTSICRNCSSNYFESHFFWNHTTVRTSLYSLAKGGEKDMSLTIENVSMSFGDRKVLEDLSIHIESGEFVSLIGPSGSGKSTLFNLIGGRLSPDCGDILMNEESIKNKSGQISYMPQQASLFPWRSILDNVLLGQELYGERNEELATEMLV